MMKNKNINDDEQPNGNTDKKITSYSKENSTKTNFWETLRVKKLNEQPMEGMNLRNLLRYATLIDVFYMMLATIASFVFGITMSLDYVIFGNSVNVFINRSSNLCSLNLTSLTQDYCPPGITLTSINFYTSMSLCNLTEFNLTNINYNFEDQTRKQIIYSVIVGCVSLICRYIRVALFNIAAERQTRTIRRILFKSILEKDIVFFDNHQSGELNSLLIDHVEKIRDAIGNKFGSIMTVISIVISSLVIGFINGWKLTLVILSISPLIVMQYIITSKVKWWKKV